MGHTLKKLRVDKIAILTEANPATGIPLVILKSNKDLAEVMAAVNDFFGDDGFDSLELEKAIDKKKLLDAVSFLKRYRSDLPDDVQAAVDQLVKYAASAYGYGRYPKKEDEDKDLKKSVKDDWPSMQLAPLIVIQKKDEPKEDDEDLIIDPIENELHEINKRLEKIEDKSPKDDWPSLYIPQFIQVKKSEKGKFPPADPDPNKPISKQIRDEIVVKEIEVDDEDPWPSVIDPYIMAGKG